MPNLTQLLSIELGTECNLGHVHAACPNHFGIERYAHLDTTRTLNDGMIVRIASSFYRWGFTGLVAFHYYQEPLLQSDRMFSLMRQIKAADPKARFLLWTNGTLLPADCSAFSAFEQIHITDYGPAHPPQNVAALTRVCRNVQVHRWQLDKRLQAPGVESARPCLRPFTEFIVDNFGNVHLCCYDWRGLASPGNVFTTPLDKILQRWAKIREHVCRNTMKPEAPEACRRCQMKCGTITAFDVDAKRRAEAWRGESLVDDPKPNAGKPAVVFVFYRNPRSKNPIPLKRLADHFELNEPFYRNSKARVFVVTAEPHEVPDFAECVVFPERLLPVVDGVPKFSLSRTKNFGIAAAVARGHDPIIVTDPDIAIAYKAWEQCLAVNTAQAVIPVYWMAQNFDRRTDRCQVKSNAVAQEHFLFCSKSHEDRGATGMVAMCAANWQRIRYDERCYGYGAEDGFLLQEIRLAKLREMRDTIVYHIAHNAGAPQANFTREGFTRADAWDTEFNPLNFDGNKKAHRGE